MSEPQDAHDFFATSAAAAAPGGVSTLPTADQFFASSEPQSGAAHDAFWSSAANAGARILDSVGYGASQAWGDKPLGSFLTEPLTKSGYLNDYKAGQSNWLKAANEALLRPAIDLAGAIDFAGRGFGIPALAAGAGGGLTQAGAEIEGEHPTGVRQALAFPFRAAGELSYGFAEGAFLGELGENIKAPEAERAQTASTARAVGAVGEGEAGFYGAEPVSPENLQARATAAEQTGITPPLPEPPPPDVHALARRIDPETFQEYDALAAERGIHAAALQRLSEERLNSPEAIEAQGRIDTILERVNGVESRLTQVAAQRLADAQAELNQALRTDTQEMSSARARLMDADFAMRDLAPEVSAAYRNAREIAPELPEEAPLEAAAAEPGSAETPADGQARTVAPVAAEAAGGTAEGQAATANVLEKPPGEAAPAAAAPQAGAEQAKAAPRTTSNIKAIEGQGEQEVRRVSERSEENAIAAGLTETFGDLPTYGALKDVDQARIVTDLMGKDYERAKAIAMGQREPPKGATPEAFLIGVENRALAEGDFETAFALKDSKLAKAGTTMGQRLSTYRLRTKESPVEHIREVQAAREAGFKGDLAVEKAKTVSEIKAEVAKAASKADKWNDFLSILKCGE